MNPFRMNCGRYQSRTCWKEGGRHSVIQPPPPCHNRQKPPLPPSHGRLNGELQDFSIITSGVSFSVVQWGIDHSCGGSGAETALQKSNHAFFGRWAGNRYLNRTELLGTNGSFGIEEGPQTEVEKGPACLSEQRRNLQSLEGISFSGTGKMCCCRDGSRKLHASWIDARRSRGGFQLRTISLQRRAKSLSTHQGASCTDYITF